MTQGKKPAPKTVSTQWVLLRGLGREARHWGEFPADLKQALSKMSPHARVDTIDLPGAGRYSEMKSPISMFEITEFVREKYLEIRNRQREAGETPASETYLVAVSLGGMVASQWMERWPRELNGCVLVNSSFAGLSPAVHRLQPRAYLHLFNIMRERKALGIERHVLKMISNRSELHEKTAAEWASIFESRPLSSENFLRQLTAASRFRTSLKTPPVPVLILSSNNDMMVHPSCSEKIAQLWQCELRKHPTAGHDLPHDHPKWMVEQIVSWFRALHSGK